MESEISKAIRYICDEKGLAFEVVVSTIEAALAAAYRKDFGQPNQNVVIKFNPESGAYQVFDVKTVVADLTEEEIEAEREELKQKREAALALRMEGKEAIEPEEEKQYYNPKMHLMLSEAKKINEGAELGQEISQELSLPSDFGRMAAQTAKQVVTQKLREAERNTIFDDFKGKEDSVVIGIVQRREGRNVIIDLGRAMGIMPMDQQIRTERYNSGQRLKLYVMSVDMGPKGPMITLSRAHSNIVKKLFETEIPEIGSGTIKMMAIAREAGSRTKVAVQAIDENIDPIGSCVGQRGTRIQTIISELGGEKVDVIEYNEDLKIFIANALSPAKITSMTLDEVAKTASVRVAEDQLSLAIGKAGQNVRLASKLTGWAINIQANEKVATEETAVEAEAVVATEEAVEESVQPEVAQPAEVASIVEEKAPEAKE